MELTGAVSPIEPSSARLGYPAKVGILRYFEPGNLVRQDLRWIIRAACVEGANTSLTQVIKEAEDRTCQIWRMDGKGCEGILVTRVLEAKEVFVWLLAGHGFIRVAEQVFVELEEFAIQNECNAISCIAIPALGRVLQRKLGFKTIAVAIKRGIHERH